MKMCSLLSALFLTLGLLIGANPTLADQKRTFGFFGEVDSFDRTKQMLVVDDRVFRIDDSVRVHKKKGRKATLSDIIPGVKVGFYPAKRDENRQNNYIDEIWILPSNWKAKRGYADNLER